MDNSLLKHLFPARLLPRWAILFLDLAMVGGAVLLASAPTRTCCAILLLWTSFEFLWC